MNPKTFHPGKLALYGTLSFADFYLTYRLLQQGGGHVYEGNPIANAWLAAYGWSGLLVFKLMAVVLVATAAMFISVTRPQTAGRLLAFACLTVSVVVVYSTYLSRTHAKPGTPGNLPGRGAGLQADTPMFGEQRNQRRLPPKPAGMGDLRWRRIGDPNEGTDSRTDTAAQAATPGINPAANSQNE
jgi:hypothetical protein